VDQRGRYSNLPKSKAAVLRTLLKSDFAVSIHKLHALVLNHIVERAAE
jgi:hypothetical protein